MNTNKLKLSLYLSFFLFSLLLGLALLVTEVKAIGQISEPIIVENALRGQTIEQTMSLLNTDNNDILFGLDADGDIMEWATFYALDDHEAENPITETQIEARGKKGVRVIFQVPEDTANGVYTGNVSVYTKLDDEDDGITTVQQRIPREVTITVTDDEDINFTTSFIADRETVLGEPLKVRIVYYNEGNTVIKPQIEIKAYQVDNVFYNVILPYPANEEGVKPLRSREIPVEIQTRGAVIGMADLEMRIVYQEETIEENKMRFRLSESGTTLANKFSDKKPKGNSLVLYGSGLVFLAMGLFAGNILKRRNDKNKKTVKKTNGKKANGTKRKTNGTKKSVKKNGANNKK